MKNIVIGTRGSKLALVQTNIVKKKLQKIAPQTKIAVKVITTTGDKNLNPVPLDSIGKGWFTKEIDKELLEGNIDLAVHSLKDLPEALPEGLIIAALPEREDAREAMVSKNSVIFEKLAKGAVIGTDSTRRSSQILHKRPDLVVKSLRGNVNTRLEKLQTQNYDAIFLAVAGLKRLGFEKRIAQYFPIDEMIPSPGQGALAVVTKESNTKLNKLLSQVNHRTTVIAVTTERKFSEVIGGGCKMPVGAYAEVSEDMITLYGFVGSADGKYLVKDSLSDIVENHLAVGEQLAKKLLMQSKSWYSKHHAK